MHLIEQEKLKASFKIVNNNNGFSIIVDIDYVVYTEEPWISSKWKGRQNPNLYWLKNGLTRYINTVAGELKGVVVNVD